MRQCGWIIWLFHRLVHVELNSSWCNLDWEKLHQSEEDVVTRLKYHTNLLHVKLFDWLDESISFFSRPFKFLFRSKSLPFMVAVTSTHLLARTRKKSPLCRIRTLFANCRQGTIMTAWVIPCEVMRIPPAFSTPRATEACCWQAEQNFSSSHFQVGTAALGCIRPCGLRPLVVVVRFWPWGSGSSVPAPLLVLFEH